MFPSALASSSPLWPLGHSPICKTGFSQIPNSLDLGLKDNRKGAGYTERVTGYTTLEIVGAHLSQRSQASAAMRYLQWRSFAPEQQATDSWRLLSGLKGK